MYIFQILAKKMVKIKQSMQKIYKDKLSIFNNKQALFLIYFYNKLESSLFDELNLKGYETNVGSKGTQLSGGQKQRVCIGIFIIRVCTSFYLIIRTIKKLNSTSLD